jgi:AmmeMemoRadiSam system protein B
MSDTPPAQPKFDADKPHQMRPKLRRVRGFPVGAQTPDGKQQVLLGLADAQQISDKMVATVPAAQQILPLFDGSHTPGEVASEVGKGLTADFVESLIAQLDDAGLLEGPRFDAMLGAFRTQFDSSDTLPPGSSMQLAEALAAQALGEDATDEQKEALAGEKLAEAMDQWIDQALAKASDPSLDELPRAIVAPHIDYPRGWINYGAIWGRLRVTDRPDRVVILGTNHFGFATGVCGCDKGFESPFGVCAADTELIERLRSALGPEDAERLFANRYDHEREHSIELQIPWIQHCLGKDEAGEYAKVFGVLIHDPAVNNGESYDGNGLALQPFVDAMKKVLAELPGRTLVVSSADLSHAGPAFGDQRQLAGDDAEAQAFRQRIARQDQELLKFVVERRPDDLIASMAWQQNPTRWCSTGNLVAALKIVEPEEVKLLSYVAAMDPQGASLVSQAALAMR